jgi:Tfp pilus assembly protein PilE
MSKAMTLVELVIVCIMLGVLLSLGSVMYRKTHEKGRAAEARAILGFIRTAEENYKLDKDNYGNLTDLDIEVQTACSDGTHYFNYTAVAYSASTFTATATRCTAGGKAPPGKSAYYLTLNQDGKLTLSEEGY